MSDRISDKVDQDLSGDMIDLENRMKENFYKLSKSPNSWGFKLFQVLMDDADEFKKLEGSSKILSILAECDINERRAMIKCLEEIREIYR